MYDTNEKRETLRGLTGLAVLVEEVSRDLERAGLSRSQLQTDAELRLRKAGIRVLTPEEALATAGGPFLYINVSGGRVRSEDGFLFHGSLLGYGVCIRVSLHQEVRLARDPAVTAYDAETWSSDGILQMVDVSSLRLIRESVADQVDQFINAYLAVNSGRTPVQASTPEPTRLPRKDKRR